MTLDRAALLEMAAAFRPACVLGAAAELELFAALGDAAASAEELAGRLAADLRGLEMLLDALAALGVLAKQGDRYRLADGLAAALVGPESVLPMVLHNMNILRNWEQLAWVAKTGRPAERRSSLRGADADRAAFVAAMHTVSGPVADGLIRRLAPRFTRMLDVGGASGTWALAFLRTSAAGRAVLFDLPDAVEQARARLAAGEFAARVELVAGDFYRDELPADVDYAWVSAIIHQHSRGHNRALFAKVYRALRPGGRIGVRDFVMQPDRVHPPLGAMFAINMLVNTESGGTFTFDEIAADLRSAGFTDVRLAIAADDMNAVVEATK